MKNLALKIHLSFLCQEDFMINKNYLKSHHYKMVDLRVKIKWIFNPIIVNQKWPCLHMWRY